MSWVWHHKKLRHVEPDWSAPVADSKHAQLEYIYAWERRCRGYAIHPVAVNIEPPWVAFDPHNINGLTTQAPALPVAPGARLCHLALQFPLDQKVTTASAQGFLQTMLHGRGTLAFEIIATAQDIAYQLTAEASLVQSIRSSAQMQWPKADIEQGHDALEEAVARCVDQSSLPAGNSAINSFVVNFGLSNFAYAPLRCFEAFQVDPLAAMLAGLGQVGASECAGLQVLLRPANPAWNHSLLQIAEVFATEERYNPSDLATQRSSQKSPYHPTRSNPSTPGVSGGEFMAARSKLSYPLWAVVIRVFAVSREGQQRAFDLCRLVGGALGVFDRHEPGGNSLLALANEDPYADDTEFGNTCRLPGTCRKYPDTVHISDVRQRLSHRSGLLLSLPELVGFVHPPTETLHHPRLVRLDPQIQSLPPHLLHARGALLGIHPYRRQEQPLVWPDDFRNRHAYLLGATRMGKSTLLHNLIQQDMAAGRGLCLIDPHGDLALEVLGQVPHNRVDDTIYLDLSDREYPLALGLLETQDDFEQRLLCSDLLSIMKRLFASSWGDRLEHILRHAILTLLAATPARGRTNGRAAYTLRDIRPLLSNKGFRQRVIQDVQDPELKTFWTSEFLGYTSSAFSPLYNKLGQVVSTPLVRNIVSQQESRLSFAEVMQRRQILLVNLASSRIGGDNAHFLGALLVSKLQIAAMQSLRLCPQLRVPFTLYVDEFQNFVVSSFETILSEAGKAGLSLVMANQFLEQLPSHLQTAILSNVGTLVSFRVSSDSGRLLEREFAGRFKAHEMVSLGRGEAVARVGSAADSYYLQTLPPARTGAPSIQTQPQMDTIVRQSRRRVCRRRDQVESEMQAAMALQAAEQAAAELATAERADERRNRAAEERKQAAEERKRAAEERKGLPKGASSINASSVNSSLVGPGNKQPAAKHRAAGPQVGSLPSFRPQPIQPSTTVPRAVKTQVVPARAERAGASHCKTPPQEDLDTQGAPHQQEAPHQQGAPDQQEASDTQKAPDIREARYIQTPDGVLGTCEVLDGGDTSGRDEPEFFDLE